MNKFEGLMNAHPRKRYKSFVTTVADTEVVWLDCDPHQLVLTERDRPKFCVNLQSKV